MLLNTPAGTPTFRTTNLQMARLTDEKSSRSKSYLKVENGQPVLYLRKTSRLSTSTPSLGDTDKSSNRSTETVVVRQEGSFWAPFAGAAAGSMGQAIGALFRPQYYVPPVYQPGASVLRGFGYGGSYSQAVDR